MICRPQNPSFKDPFFFSGVPVGNTNFDHLLKGYKSRRSRASTAQAQLDDISSMLLLYGQEMITSGEGVILFRLDDVSFEISARRDSKETSVTMMVKAPHLLKIEATKSGTVKISGPSVTTQDIDAAAEAIGLAYGAVEWLNEDYTEEDDGVAVIMGEST